MINNNFRRFRQNLGRGRNGQGLGLGLGNRGNGQGLGRGLGRRKNPRCINLQQIPSNFFKPNGIPLTDLEVIQLERDELEALRLKNVEELDQTEAAEQMKVSQSTFGRILNEAYRKISLALVQGLAIEIKED